MSDMITIQSLIRHFEARLRQIDRSLGAAAGKEPQFPMLVVFLGEGAIKGFSSLSFNLFRVWPQYQNELQFLGVTADGDATNYCILAADENGEVRRKNISGDEVSAIVTFLFSLKNHFQDRSKLLVYYIIDTTDFSGPKEYDKWLDIQKGTKALLGADPLDMLDMLVILLNENFSKRDTALQIRDRLSRYYDERADIYRCHSVLLLSNKRDDNAILMDSETCFRICASVILLSNNTDVRASERLFGRCIMTAGYAREEKPSEKIGQVIVGELIDELSKNDLPANIGFSEDDKLCSKLGLTKEGTFNILDEYAEETLMPLLPTAGQLSLFPRKNDSDYADADMGDLCAREFNDLTMNSWDCYLSMSVSKAKEKVRMNSRIRQDWDAKYNKALRSGFTAKELICLGEHLNDVRRIFARKEEPSQEARVLDAAAKRLKYMLSSDPELIDMFIGAIKARAEEARGFDAVWNRLLQSRRNVFSVRDKNISRFYEKKARNFFDRHGNNLLSEFKKIQDADELLRFLKDTLNKIIDSDRVFTSSFEEELENRLREETPTADTKQYIRRMLTGDDVHTYLQVNFSFDNPILSAILIKAGTPLYHNLLNNLDESRYYYNTGYGNAAEAVIIYEVGTDNLLNSESR